MLAVHPPAREERFGEESSPSVIAAAEDISQELLTLPSRPVVLFGYSLGALLAYETARALRLAGVEPTALCVAAFRAPHLVVPQSRALSDADVIEELRGFGGMPRELLANAEFLELIIPSVRGDMRLVDHYAYDANRGNLGNSIIAYGGAADRACSPVQLDAWRELTEGPFKCKVFDGGHFFLSGASESLAEELARDIGPLLDWNAHAASPEMPRQGT